MNNEINNEMNNEMNNEQWTMNNHWSLIIDDSWLMNNE